MQPIHWIVKTVQARAVDIEMWDNDADVSLCVCVCV